MSEEKSVLNLDSTQISAWLECHRKWKLGYDEHLVPLVEAKAFSTGKLVHRLLECYYRLKMVGVDSNAAMNLSLQFVKNWLESGVCANGNHPIAEYLTKEWESEYDPENKPADSDWSFLSVRFISYCSQYSDENFKVKDVEVGFSVPILETKDNFFVLEGRLDLLLEDPDGNLWWTDHKSQARDYDHYVNSVQFLNYAVALGTRHGMINYFGLQKNVVKGKDSFFRRKPFLFSQGILKEWKMELISIFSEVARAKKLGCFRKNRNSCKHGLNRQCEFTHICEQTIPEFENEIKRVEFRTREAWSPWRLEENGE